MIHNFVQENNLGSGPSPIFEVMETGDELAMLVASKASIEVVQKKPARVYYLDWLRMTAIYLVVFFHCIQALKVAKFWDDAYLPMISAYECTCLQIGMPIFVHIAGRSRALSRTDGFVTVVIRRFLRLGAPLLLGYVLLIVPLWQYSYLPDEVPGSPRHFIPWIIWFFQPGHFTFTLSWLWLLPVLFGIEVFSLPVILLAEKRTVDYVYGCACLFGLLVFLLTWCCGIPFVMTCVIMMGPAVSVCSVMIFGFPSTEEIPLWRPRHWLAVQTVTVTQVLSHMILMWNIGYGTLFVDNPFGITDPEIHRIDEVHSCVSPVLRNLFACLLCPKMGA